MKSKLINSLKEEEISGYTGTCKNKLKGIEKVEKLIKDKKEKKV